MCNNQFLQQLPRKTWTVLEFYFTFIIEAQGSWFELWVKNTSDFIIQGDSWKNQPRGYVHTTIKNLGKSENIIIMYSAKNIEPYDQSYTYYWHNKLFDFLYPNGNPYYIVCFPWTTLKQQKYIPNICSGERTDETGLYRVETEKTTNEKKLEDKINGWKML